MTVLRTAEKLGLIRTPPALCQRRRLEASPGKPHQADEVDYLTLYPRAAAEIIAPLKSAPPDWSAGPAGDLRS